MQIVILFDNLKLYNSVEITTSTAISQMSKRELFCCILGILVCKLLLLPLKNIFPTFKIPFTTMIFRNIPDIQAVQFFHTVDTMVVVPCQYGYNTFRIS